MERIFYSSSVHDEREIDAVVERGVLLPLSHALGDDDIAYIASQVDDFLRNVFGLVGLTALRETKARGSRRAPAPV